jgi:hypothetical protein
MSPDHLQPTAGNGNCNKTHQDGHFFPLTDEQMKMLTQRPNCFLKSHKLHGRPSRRHLKKLLSYQLGNFRFSEFIRQLLMSRPMAINRANNQVELVIH